MPELRFSLPAFIAFSRIALPCLNYRNKDHWKTLLFQPQCKIEIINLHDEFLSSPEQKISATPERRITLNLLSKSSVKLMTF